MQRRVISILMGMNFQLKPFYRNISDEDLLEDLRRIGLSFGGKIQREQYNSLGKYHSSTVEKRFGTWNKALLKAGLEIITLRDMTDENLLEDLRRVAMIFDGKIKMDQYNSKGNYHSSTLEKRFGTWNKALIAAGLEVSSSRNATNDDLFENIAQVWLKTRKTTENGRYG